MKTQAVSAATSTSTDATATLATPPSAQPDNQAAHKRSSNHAACQAYAQSRTLPRKSCMSEAASATRNIFAQTCTNPTVCCMGNPPSVGGENLRDWPVLVRHERKKHDHLLSGAASHANVLAQSTQRSGKNASDIDEQSTGLSSAGQTRKFSDFIVECLDRDLEGMKRPM
jgi:hypothetical protein